MVLHENIFELFYYLESMDIFFAYMQVYHVYKLPTYAIKGGIGPPETLVTEGRKLSCTCWESNQRIL